MAVCCGTVLCSNKSESCCCLLLLPGGCRDSVNLRRSYSFSIKQPQTKIHIDIICIYTYRYNAGVPIVDIESGFYLLTPENANSFKLISISLNWLYFVAYLAILTKHILNVRTSEKINSTSNGKSSIQCFLECHMCNLEDEK